MTLEEMKGRTEEQESGVDVSSLSFSSASTPHESRTQSLGSQGEIGAARRVPFLSAREEGVAVRGHERVSVKVNSGQDRPLYQPTSPPNMQIPPVGGAKLWPVIGGSVGVTYAETAGRGHGGGKSEAGRTWGRLPLASDSPDGRHVDGGVVEGGAVEG